MNILIKTDVEVTTDQIKNALTPEELASLISDIANWFAEIQPTDYKRRRQVMRQMNENLSENGNRFLAELAGLEFSRCTLPTE